MPTEDQTRRALEELLAALYKKSAKAPATKQGRSYLESADGQFLGEITADKFDQNSLLNQFGPYGSRFSPTSIFNQFGDFGSRFHDTSATNEFANHPPRVFIHGEFRAYLTENQFVKPRVSFADFVHTLRTDPTRAKKGEFQRAPEV